MKKIKIVFVVMLACLMLVQVLPLSALAEAVEPDDTAALDPLAVTMVSALRPDVAIGKGSDSLRINGGLDDESAILLSFSSNQLAGKNKLTLNLPVANATGEIITVGLIDNYTVDPDTATYNALADRMNDAKIISTVTLSQGNNAIDLSALLDMTLTSRFTLVLRSAALDENIHAFFYDFEEYAISNSHAFFKNPSANNSGGKGYLDGVNNKTFILRGSNTNSDQNSIVIDPEDSTGENKVMSNWIGGILKADGTVSSEYKNSGRLRVFDALSHDVLTTEDVGTTLRFGFKLKIDNEAGNATAKFSMGTAEATSTSQYYTVSSKAISEADGWQSFYVDYTIVEGDVPPNGEGSREGGDRMFAFSLSGGTAQNVVNWYIDDIYTVQLNDEGLELCAVVDGNVSLTAEFATDATPVVAGMVSSAKPTTNYASKGQLAVSGYSEDLRISYLTFNKADLGDGKYAALTLPGLTDGEVEVDIFLIDDYAVNPSDFNFDKRYTLENCPLIATRTLSSDSCTIVFENPAARIEGETFTLALCAKNTYSDYVLRIDFEDFASGYQNIAVNASATDQTSYSSNYLFRSGGATGFFSAANLEGNMVAVYTTNASYNRFKVHNSFSDKALTADDAGTYRVRFRVMADADTALLLGTIQPVGSALYENSGKGTQYDLTAGKWRVIEHDIKLTETMIASDYSMFNVNFTKANVKFYFDDFSISKLNADGEETTPIARINKAGVALRTLDANLPLADAYASEANPDTVYGKSKDLILATENGKAGVVAVSYLAEALRANTLFNLPAGTPGQVVNVVAVDGVAIDEYSFNYNKVADIARSSVYVGRYILGEPIEIDLQGIKDDIKSDVFTLLIVADPSRVMEETFEGRKSSDILGNTAPSYNCCYSDKYIISVGGGGKTTAGFVDLETEDGVNRVFHVNGYNRRYKFWNTITDKFITATDIGRKFRVTYDIMCTSDATVYSGLKCGTGGNGTTTGPAGGGYETNTYHSKQTVNLKANVWQTVSFEVTIDQTIVNHQVGLVTIDFATGTTVRDYYVDNMRVEEIGGNAEDTLSSFEARESNGAGLALSGRGFIDASEITLDGSVTVLEASVSLLIPDNASSTADIFRIYDASRDYTLLSLDNKTGELFFVMDGETYTLCDGKGNAYTASEAPMTVIAFYDNTAGTVRFAVDDKLAYYTDGEEAAITFALPLVNGGHTGKATVSAFCSYNDAVISLSVSKIAADKPTLVGTQTSVVSDSIRVLSGIDTLYYSKVGFMVEREGKQTLSWSDNYILTSVNALNETVSAEQLGTSYLSAFVLSELNTAKTGDSIRIIPTAYVGANVVKGDPVTLVFTVENGKVSATVDTTAPDLEGYRIYTMGDAAGKYRPLGRVKTEGDTLICDWSASGAEFVLDCEDNVYVTFNAGSSAGEYLTSFVDGVKAFDIILEKGVNTYLVAENLTKGEHTVRIVAQYAQKTGAMNAVRFKGELKTASPSDTFVEIIGDSITCGALLSPQNGNYATASYAYVAMNALDSDYATCSRGGQALSVPSGASGFYSKFNGNRSSEAYVPARTADLIVVNLIVNDNWQWYKQNNNVVDEEGTWSYENFDKGVAEFFATLESIHDLENTPIVFVFGCNWTEKSKNFVAYDRLMILFDEIYYDKYDIKTVRLTGDASASDGGHPNAAAAQIQGQELAAFLRENYSDLFPAE